MQKRSFSVIMSKRELILGLCFLPFYLILLSLGLQLLLRAIGLEPDAALLNGCYYVVCIVAVALIFHRFLRDNLRLMRKRWAVVLRTVPILLIAYLMLTTVVNLIILSILPDFANQNNDALLSIMGVRPALVVILSVLLAPVIEETLFRGLIFGGLRRFGRLPAYAVTMLFFSAIHVVSFLGMLTPLETVLSLVQYVPATLILCAIYEYTDTIYAPMLLHSAVNLVACLTMSSQF